LSSGSLDRLIGEVRAALDQLPEDDDGIRALAALFYPAAPALTALLVSLREYRAIQRPTAKQREEAGLLMEKIAWNAFGNLLGRPWRKAFRSPAGQLDLLVGGESPRWAQVTKALHPRSEGMSILVEAKATSDKVSVGTFTRLCALIALTQPETCGIGVFFTLKGATGFPAGAASPSFVLRDARFWQAIMYAKTGKPIVVLDERDVLTLAVPGSLVVLMRRKIRELEEMTGLPATCPDAPVEDVVPGYLLEPAITPTPPS
jgi:hypothetical protein